MGLTLVCSVAILTYSKNYKLTKKQYNRLLLIEQFEPTDYYFLHM